MIKTNCRTQQTVLKTKDLTQQVFTSAKDGVPEKEPVSVANLVLRYCHYASNDTKSMCKCILHKDLWDIEADEGQLGQVITSILINADQAMPDGGTISVRCENAVVIEDDALPLKNGNYVKITINDQGKGIAQEDIYKIFDPYFTTKETGRGLGLAAAYSVIKKLGGHIAVESAPEAGASFTLFLPVLSFTS